MTLENTRHCGFTARLDCRYLLHAPAAVDDRTLLVATLHGFSANPEAMLRLTAAMLGPRHVIAAVEGPNQFYLAQGSNEVGYGWATHKHPDSSVRLHHDMLLHVLNEAGREYGIPTSRRILAGFSQPVGMNYRFAATHPGEIHGVIGICGGLPRNWEEGPYQQVTAAVLHIARREDEFYKPEVTERYAERLRLRAADVEFQPSPMPGWQPPLVDHLDPQAARLIQLRAGLLARHHKAGLPADGAAHLAARGFDHASGLLAAQVRQRPGEHERHPASGPPFLRLTSYSNFSPAARSRSTNSWLRGSWKNW
jgi:predicted esterase